MDSPPEGTPPPETPETKGELKEKWTIGQRWAPIAFGLLPDDEALKRRPDVPDGVAMMMFMP